jgi:hypothetical protein
VLYILVDCRRTRWAVGYCQRPKISKRGTKFRFRNFLLLNIVSSHDRKCFPFTLLVQSSLIQIPDHVRKIFNMVEAVFSCIRLCFLLGWSASVSERRDRWCCFLTRGTGANCCSWPNLGRFCADQRACPQHTWMHSNTKYGHSHLAVGRLLPLHLYRYKLQKLRLSTYRHTL